VSDLNPGLSGTRKQQISELIGAYGIRKPKEEA
jgi:hypothetical protein